MLIHRISFNMANRLANSIGWGNRVAEITYGLELVIGETFKFALLLALASVLGITRETVLVLSTALPYRLAAGGPHCHTYFRCTVFTVLSYILLGKGAATFLSHWSNQYSAVLIISVIFISGIVIHNLVPGENPNRQIRTIAEKRNFQIYSTLIAGFWVTLSAVVCVFLPISSGKFVLPTGLGLLWQNFVVTPAGYRLLGSIDNLRLRR